MEEIEEYKSIKEQLPVSVVSTNKFLLLNLLSLNLYTVWWMYKAWTIIKHKEESDILPVPRAIFGIFFIYSLFQKIKDFALQHAYTKDFSPILLYMGIVIVNVVPAFPEMKEKFGILSLMASLFFVAPNEALNYALLNSKDFKPEEEVGFNSRQLILIFIGISLWAVYLDAILNG